MKRFDTMSRQLHRRAGRRKIVGLTAVAALGLAAAACSSSSPSNSASSSGPVTITVNCQPPATATAQHKEWNEDVAAFEKANPNITIKSVTYTGQCEVPAQFTATLKAGTETNLYYAYFTDLHQVLNAGQAADITSYVNSKTVPALADIVPSAMATASTATATTVRAPSAAGTSPPRWTRWAARSWAPTARRPSTTRPTHRRPRRSCRHCTRCGSSITA